MKKPFLLITAIIAFATPFFAQKGTSSKPNIIFIYTDDLGYGDLSCYGANTEASPGIEPLKSNEKQNHQFVQFSCNNA